MARRFASVLFAVVAVVVVLASSTPVAVSASEADVAGVPVAPATVFTLSSVVNDIAAKVEAEQREAKAKLVAQAQALDASLKEIQAHETRVSLHSRRIVFAEPLIKERLKSALRHQARVTASVARIRQQLKKVRENRALVVKQRDEVYENYKRQMKALTDAAAAVQALSADLANTSAAAPALFELAEHLREDHAAVAAMLETAAELAEREHHVAALQAMHASTAKGRATAGEEAEAEAEQITLGGESPLSTKIAALLKLSLSEIEASILHLNSHEAQHNAIFDELLNEIDAQKALHKGRLATHKEWLARAAARSKTAQDELDADKAKLADLKRISAELSGKYKSLKKEADTYAAIFAREELDRTAQLNTMRGIRNLIVDAVGDVTKAANASTPVVTPVAPAPAPAPAPSGAPAAASSAPAPAPAPTPAPAPAASGAAPASSSPAAPASSGAAPAPSDSQPAVSAAGIVVKK